MGSRKSSPQHSDYVAQLTDVLNLLASDAETQLKYLEDLGIPGQVDELALEFDDLEVLIDAKRESGDVTQRQVDLISKLSQKLDAMSGQQRRHLWMPEALKSSKEWQVVRELASDCLQSFRYEKKTAP